LKTYKILFVGDVVGRPGRRTLQKHLPELIHQHKPLFTIVNGENSASGVGITPDIAEFIYKLGADVITLGNHAFNKREIIPFLNSKRPIIRPANYPERGVPGRGVVVISKGGIDLAVVNMCGRVYMDGYDDPFTKIDGIFEELKTDHVLIDFHAEATSEKYAFGYYVDGKATAVLGTHTHVQTADEQVLEKGTAYISDVGMCGPMPSVIGMDRDIILHRFLTSMPTKFEVAASPGVISAVALTVHKDTGRAADIQRIRLNE
jgi:metallophosphoesterase (TIGR00282 family)